MSGKDSNDGLNDAQRAVFDQYTEVCAQNFDKLALNLKMGCTDHAALLNSMIQQKQMVTQLQKVTLLNDWLNRWQTQAVAMLASFVNASSAYDMILGLKAAKPIRYNVILELAVIFLPEIKPLEKAFSLLATKRHPSADVIDSFANVGVFIKAPKTQSTPNLITLLDRRSKDFTNIGRGWSSSGAQAYLDIASIRLKSAYQAKNSVFNDLIETAIEGLMAVTSLGSKMTVGILDATLPKAKLMAEIGKYDPGKILTPDAYKLLANQILYQMIRIYVWEHCKIFNVTNYMGGLKGDDVSNYRELEGIDDAGLVEIFGRFSAESGWKGDHNYPQINSVDDMIPKWAMQFKVENKQKDSRSAASVF